jgi:DNA modification methylase
MTWTLHEGDCLDVLRDIPSGSVDAVITDPPYVIGAVSSGVMTSKAGSWSDMMNSAYWFKAWYSEAWRVLADHGCMWSFCNWRSLPVVMNAAQQAKISITSLLVWDKVWIGPGGTQGLRPRYELIALLAKPAFSIPNRGIGDIVVSKWTAHKPTGHPAEKPVSLVEWLAEISAVRAGGTVLDPFAGSGTTGVAAIKNGFNFIGIEREPAYCEIARKRLADAEYSGQQSALAT